MQWTITYYNDRVFKRICKLPLKLRARFLALADVLIEQGPNIGMPHSRILGNGLLELRIKAKEGIARVFYCAQVEKEIIVLHSFVKKSQKLPKKELSVAMKRLKKVKENDKAFYEMA